MASHLPKLSEESFVNPSDVLSFSFTTELIHPHFVSQEPHNHKTASLIIVNHSKILSGMTRLPGTSAQSLCQAHTHVHTLSHTLSRSNTDAPVRTEALHPHRLLYKREWWPWFSTEYKTSWAIISLMQSVWSPSSTLISASTFNHSLLPAD